MKCYGHLPEYLSYIKFDMQKCFKQFKSSQ